MKTAPIILILALATLFVVPARSAIVLHPYHTNTAIFVPASHPDGDNAIKVVHRKKIGWLGIAALSSGVIGLAVGGIPFGIGGIVFGILGLVGKHRKLKGLALSGLILGCIDILIVLIVLAVMA